MTFEELKFDIPNFTLHELTRTEHREYVKENRKLEQWQADKLAHLALAFLLPIRTYFGKPMHILSGYRCKPLNLAVGSSLVSQHTLCEAADFEIEGRTSGSGLFEVFEWIVKESELQFGQCIFELGEWIHISVGEPYRLRTRSRQALVYKENSDGTKGYEIYKG